MAEGGGGDTFVKRAFLAKCAEMLIKHIDRSSTAHRPLIDRSLTAVKNGIDRTFYDGGGG